MLGESGTGLFGCGGEGDRAPRCLRKAESPPAADWSGVKTPEDSFTTPITALAEVYMVNFQQAFRPRIQNLKYTDDLGLGVTIDDRVAYELWEEIVRGVESVEPDIIPAGSSPTR